MKKVEVLQPFSRNCLPFLMPLYDIMKTEGYKVVPRKKLFKGAYALSYSFPLNCTFKLLSYSNNAYLLLMSAIHTNASLFPYAYNHEIIPVIWDCWPKYRRNVEQMFERCFVRMAFFSSSETAEYFKMKFPSVNVFFLPEVFDKSLYHEGDILSNRCIDVLDYGRSNAEIETQLIELSKSGRNVLYPQENKHLFKSFDDLAHAIANSKIVISYPRSVTNPDVAEGVETLTQRYWECMYSRAIMVGKAPKELVELLGYNPVINCTIDNIGKKVKEILSYIGDYQELVNRNYNSANICGDFHVRLSSLNDILNSYGYKLSKNEL